MRISFETWQALTSRVIGLAALAMVLGFGASPTAAQVCGDGVVGGGEPCVGDCSDDGEVTVDEIVLMVNLALGGGTDGCTNGDANLDGQITVDEIITAVNNALTGCPGSGGQDAEECDNGGICIGGNTAGMECTSDETCGLDQPGVCVGGTQDFIGCDSDADCDGGVCTRCKTFGGDGCSANCTLETAINMPLQPGQLASNGALSEGNCVGGDNAGNSCATDSECQGVSSGFCLDGSTAAVFGPFISLPLDLTGSAVLTIGKAGADGEIPVAIKNSEVILPRIPVSSIACACLRGATAATCGGVLFYKDGSEAPNCTAGFPEQEECPAEFPCAAVHGPGNTASGRIGCAGVTPNVVNFDLDCNGTPGLEPNDPIITTSGTGGEGSGYMVLSASIGTTVGACTGSGGDYGADGEFCTDDDPLSTRGSPNTIPFVTGSATGIARNVADFPGDDNGPHTVFGTPFACSAADPSISSASGVDFAGVFAACDQPTISDIVVPISFSGE